MTYHTIEPGLARLIDRSLDVEMAEKIAQWREHLAVGRVNEEMRLAFTAFGWLSSGRDPRLTPVLDADAHVPLTLPTGTSEPPAGATVIDTGLTVERVSPKRQKG